MTTTTRRDAAGQGRVRPLWDIKAVADRLDVQVRHVRRLVAEGRIPYIKWGHQIRFDPDEIERWVDSARHPITGS